MSQTVKQISITVAISACTALLSIWGYNSYMENKYGGVQEAGKLPVNYAKFFDNSPATETADFSAAATAATPAVVHIKTKTKARQVTNNLPRRSPFSDFFGGEDPFEEFFGGPRVRTIPEQRASGSGVIISEDGYIVTNNHVIDGADEINVTLPNKKTYKATMIGTDPSSDLAVIKIEGKGLPYLVYGNSDEVKLGQWVLAIGYPLSLDVTVTAGIVSAKARSIGINRQQSDRPIESFIQTDAAVNQGNSGGALINTKGELIGINSAIASSNGGFIGYSYAIPVNIVRKHVNDIIKFGAVQRAFIGISYPTEDNNEDGVLVSDVPADGAAAAAGIKKDDIITKINGVNIKTGPELQEQVARYKPGDKISVSFKRGGKEQVAQVTLRNKVGTTNLVKAENILDKLGGELENLDKKTAAANDVAGGVVVKKVGEGLLKKSRMQENFVITSLNGSEIKNMDDLSNALKNAKGTVMLKGFYIGYEGTYGYPLNLSE